VLQVTPSEGTCDVIRGDSQSDVVARTGGDREGCGGDMHAAQGEIVDQPNWVVSFYFPRVVLE